ncbi:MAG TPA: hypothetical protein VIK08_01635 [Candidatus Limnocylindrales bacterium]
MEGTRFGSALARAALAVVAVLALAACASDAPKSTPSPVPTYAPSTGAGLFPTLTPVTTMHASTEASIPDSPMTTSAIALDHPKRASSAPEGAIVFGTDVTADSKGVNLAGVRTTFAAGHVIAWRLTLTAATGGESVRVTLTTDAQTETQVDSFVAQAGWDVYYGKSLLTVAPGTYVLHYLIDGHEAGSGTFKIKGPDGAGATPTPSIAY